MLQTKYTDMNKKLYENNSLMENINIKLNMNVDLNSFFRKFYARNIITHMNKNEYDKYVEKGL